MLGFQRGFAQQLQNLQAGCAGDAGFGEQLQLRQQLRLALCGRCASQLGNKRPRCRGIGDFQ